MLIRYVILENYKSYGYSRVDFTEGTNAIIGANGAGKSTILEAIGFVLFGHRTGSLADCLREGAESGDVTVCMRSSLDERDYEIERRFTSRGTSRYRVMDPELGMAVISEGNEDVQAWLREHLRVAPTASLGALFENAVGVPQGTYTAPFLQPASVRKAVFNPLLQVEEYLTASNRLLDTQHYLEAKIASLAEEIAHAEGQLVRMSDLQAERDALAEEISSLGQRIGNLEASRDRSRRELDQYDMLEQRARETANAAERLRDQVLAQERLLDASRDALRESESAAHRTNSSRAGHEAYLEAEKRLRTLESLRVERDKIATARQTLERDMVRLGERKDHLQATLIQIEESARQLTALAPLVQRQEEAEKALKEAEECSLQHQQARREEHRAAQELDDARKRLRLQEERRAQATQMQQELHDMQDRLEKTNQAGQRASAQEAAVRAEIVRLQEQSQALSSSASAQCPVCEAALTPEHRLELLTRNKDQTATLQSRAQDLETKVESLRQEYKRLTNTIRQTEQELRELPSEGDVARARQEVERRETQHSEAEQRVAELAGATSQVESIRERLERLGNPRKDYERHQDRIAQKEDLNREWEALKERIAACAAKTGALDQQLQEYATLDSDIRETQQERAANLDDHTTYLTNYTLAKQLNKRVAQVSDLRTTLEKTQLALSTAQDKEAQARSEYDANRHRQLRDALSDIEKSLAGTRTQREERLRRQETVRNDLVYLNELAKAVQQQRAALARQSRLLQTIKMVRELLRQAGPYITRQLVRQISQEASHLYAEIMGDHGSRLRWSEDYDIVLEVDGRERSFRQLSGGEQMSAALAVRLAALHETSAIDIALFDEPTAHLDPERRDSLAENISQIKGFSQIFVISHDDTFERVAQNYVHIAKDLEGSHTTGYQESAC